MYHPDSQRSLFGTVRYTSTLHPNTISPNVSDSESKLVNSHPQEVEMLLPQPSVLFKVLVAQPQLKSLCFNLKTSARVMTSSKDA